MPRLMIRFLKWFCAPTDTNFLVAIGLFFFIFLPFGFMCVCFNNVIIDYRALKDNPMYQIITEADDLMKDLKKNVSGHNLLNDYQWLHQFNLLIRTNCYIVPDSLKYLRYTGYFMAGYNTFLMRILLSGKLPVSFFACIPIIASLISGYIDSSNLVVLGFFEFSQIVLTMMILSTFSYLYSKAKNLEAIRDRNHEQ
ncbi:unnamed protein product [Rotaria socialis]|uniref:Uncharacterized protein n=2 Tax=Rotaria socialis TaxID=392032 RepID=A0A817X2B4_9BILA|nr:unnamed protein product [Rotaria socialis]